VRDFIREYGKIGAIAAGAAFLLSLFVGLFSKNPFGTIFARALLLGILFAALCVAVVFIIKKYLPELFTSSGAERSTAVDEKERRTVDIVLPEENPMTSSVDIDLANEMSAEDAEDVESADLEEMGGAEASERTQEASPVQSPVHSMAAEEKVFNVNAGDELSDEMLTDAAGDADMAEEVETIPPAQDDEGAIDGRARGGLQSLNALPDISDLKNIGSGSAPSAPLSGSISRKKKQEDAARGFIGDEDPETLAKAIRTVMKRDEKG
jgi:hypothetical protein